MSIPILEHGLEVSVLSLVFTVCRQPQVSELEMCKVHDGMSQVCYWKHGHWMPNTRGCAVNSGTTLERALEPEPRLGESASSQQALPHFSMNQRVNHADFVVSCLSTKYSLKQALLGAGAPSA